MRKTFSDEDRKQIDGLISDVEKRTNTQIVLAVIQRSDVYTELPWKAFALGASIAGLFVLIWQSLTYGWDPTATALISVVGILGGGALFALLTLLIPQFAKQFLSEERSEVEVYQYAESLFLSRELFATSDRTGLLILVSLFERKVVIVPDKGLSDRLKNDAAKSIITEMTPYLKRSEIRKAFEAGLERISHILGTGKPKTSENELPDDIIEEKGI
jgi:putative membrane protein